MIENSNSSGREKMKTRFLRQYAGKSLFILLAFSFTHYVGRISAIANLGNMFSWLLWLAIGFYLILLAGKFISGLLTSRLSQNIAIDFRLFK